MDISHISRKRLTRFYTLIRDLPEAVCLDIQNETPKRLDTFFLLMHVFSIIKLKHRIVTIDDDGTPMGIFTTYKKMLAEQGSIKKEITDESSS